MELQFYFTEFRQCQGVCAAVCTMPHRRLGGWQPTKRPQHQTAHHGLASRQSTKRSPASSWLHHQRYTPSFGVYMSSRNFLK